MSWFTSGSIAWKLARATLAVAILLGLFAGLSQVVRDFSHQTRLLDAQVQSILASAGHSAGRAAYMLDPELAEVVVAGLREYGFVASAEIQSDYDGVLARAESPPAAKSWRTSLLALIGKKIRHYRRPLTYSEEPGKVFGELHLGVDLEQGLAGVFDRGVTVMLAELLKSLALALLLFLVVVAALARPLSALAESCNAIDPLEPGDKRIEVAAFHRGTELDRLAQNANRMLAASALRLREREESESQLRRLFDSVEVSIWDEDFSEVKKEFQQLRRRGVVDLRTYLEDNRHIAWELAGKVAINRVNRATLKMYGVASQEEFAGSLDETFSGSAIDVFIEELCAIWEGAELVQAETTNLRPDGRELSIKLTMPVPRSDGEFRHVPVSVVDISVRRALEERIRHSLKMEVLGRLAGGIADDFSNNLEIVINSLNRLEGCGRNNEKAVEQLEIAREAAQSALVLSRQLHSLSRRQARGPAPVDINVLILGMKRLVAGSLTPAIEVEMRLTEGIWLTEVDPGEFREALLNLVLNAREAMPGGGRLTIETSNASFDAGFAADNPELQAGDFVRLAVRDTGEGITPDRIGRIFEPFFTTRQQGQGRGLGLSAVFDFVKRAKGFIRVASEPGAGTTLELHLGRLSRTEAASGAGEAPPSGTGGRVE